MNDDNMQDLAPFPPPVSRSCMSSCQADPNLHQKSGGLITFFAFLRSSKHLWHGVRYETFLRLSLWSVSWVHVQVFRSGHRGCGKWTGAENIPGSYTSASLKVDGVNVQVHELEHVLNRAHFPDVRVEQGPAGVCTMTCHTFLMVCQVNWYTYI